MFGWLGGNAPHLVFPSLLILGAEHLTVILPVSGPVHPRRWRHTVAPLSHTAFLFGQSVAVITQCLIVAATSCTAWPFRPAPNRARSRGQASFSRRNPFR